MDYILGISQQSLFHNNWVYVWAAMNFNEVGFNLEIYPENSGEPIAE